MEGNYWSGRLQRRLSRRRALATAATVGLGAAALAACGRPNPAGQSGGAAKQAPSGMVTTPVDTTAQARRGGTLTVDYDYDVQTFDPMYKSLPNQILINIVYSRLMAVKPGYMKPSAGEIVGDLAESVEQPETTQVTLKLRSNAHWDPRDPTSGRVVDAQDVLFSWDRLVKQGTTRTDYAHSLSQSAPIVSVEAPDARTVVFKLAEPSAGFLSLLANGVGGAYHIMPREADGGFDPRRDTRGSGPFYMTEYVPSSRITLKRNPGYYDSQRPYIDEIHLPIITEYSQGLAQLRSGAILAYGTDAATNVHAEDIVATKQAVPQLVMTQRDMTTGGIERFFYGSRPGPNTPFRDIRVRQAFSMSWDRDLYIDTVNNVSKFKKQGLPVQTGWSSAFPPSEYTGWWLDPQSKDFGPNAKYYQYNPSEAKKLLAAAGFPNGLDVDAHYVTSGEYGPAFAPHIEIILGMARAAGIRMKTVPVNFNTDWRPKYANARGDFEGVSFIVDSGGPDPGEFLFSHYNHDGFLFMGFDPNGKGDFSGDPKMDDLTLKLRHEFDTKKRQDLANELQRYEAQQQYYPLFPGLATSFLLTWPAIQNFYVYRNGAQNLYWFYEWLDQSKPPFKM